MLQRTRTRGVRPYLGTAVALILAVCLAAPPIAAQQTQRSATITVRDATTDEPVPGVAVRTEERTVFTDQDGTAVLVIGSAIDAVILERVGYTTRRLAADEIGGVVRLSPQPVLMDAIAVDAAARSDLAAGTALSIGRVDEDEMSGGAHTSVGEAIDAAADVSVARLGAWGARPVLRGLKGNRLAIMVDGNRLYRACTFGMDQGLATIDPSTVERVEILSGPGSTLYGSGNIGGVINVITRRDDAEAPVSGEVRAGASSGTPGGFVGASLNLRGETLALSTALDLSEYGDYRSPEGVVAGSGFRHGTADLRLDYEPTAATRLSLHGQAYEGRDIGWPAMAMGEASIPSESRRSLSLDYGHQLGRGILDAVSARAYVQRLDHHMLVEMTMSGANGMTMSSATEQRSYSTTSGGRLQLRLVPGSMAHVDVGLEATEWSGEATRWTERSGMMGSSLLEFRTWPAVSVLDVGAFGQGEVRLGGALALTGGLRLDWVGREADGWPTTDEWVTTGNIGLRAHGPGGLGARLNLGYGYRVPDATELFGVALRPDGFVYSGNPELATETNRNLEGSVSYDRDWFSLEATVYRNDLENLISPVLSPGDTIAGRPVRTYDNLARATITGGSASARLHLGESVRLTATGSYTRGENPETGRALPQIPPLEGSLALRTFVPGADDAWIEVEGRAAARQDRAATWTGEVATPGYGVVNASAAFRLAGTRVVAGVDNVFDRAYRGHLDPVVLLRPGRSFFVRVSRGFGGGD